MVCDSGDLGLKAGFQYNDRIVDLYHHSLQPAAQRIFGHQVRCGRETAETVWLRDRAPDLVGRGFYAKGSVHGIQAGRSAIPASGEGGIVCDSRLSCGHKPDLLIKARSVPWENP